MNLESFYLPGAGSLIMLLGAGCGLGGVALWNGNPDNWKDVVAADDTVRKVSRGLVGISVLLIASGLTTVLRIPWGCVFGAVSTLLFVVGGFWGNYALFGDIRLKHTGTNVVIACAIWLLIGLGYPGPD